MLFNHGRIPDRLNLGLICILEAKGENKVRLSVACSWVLSPHKYTYVSIRIQDCGTVNSLSVFLYFNIRLLKIYQRYILLEFFLREFHFSILVKISFWLSSYHRQFLHPPTIPLLFISLRVRLLWVSDLGRPFFDFSR